MLSDLATKKSKESQMVNILVAILEVDGPNTVTIKNGPGQGSEVSVLKLVVSDESNSIFKLTAWREVAEHWGYHPAASASQHVQPRRGDIVYIESQPRYSLVVVEY